MLPSSRPRTCSFITRLIGGDSQTLYRPITSPYTSRILKPFIRRDTESRPLKLQLLQQIIAHGHRWIFLAFSSRSFVWLENSYGLWWTAAQYTPKGSLWHCWNSNKAVDGITCFNLDDIGWDFISVSYRLGTILSGSRPQFLQLIIAMFSLIIYHPWTPCVGNFSGQELTVSANKLRRLLMQVCVCKPVPQLMHFGNVCWHLQVPSSKILVNLYPVLTMEYQPIPPAWICHVPSSFENFSCRLTYQLFKFLPWKVLMLVQLLCDIENYLIMSDCK